MVSVPALAGTDLLSVVLSSYNSFAAVRFAKCSVQFVLVKFFSGAAVTAIQSRVFPGAHSQSAPAPPPGNHRLAFLALFLMALSISMGVIVHHWAGTCRNQGAGHVRECGACPVP